MVYFAESSAIGREGMHGFGGVQGGLYNFRLFCLCFLSFELFIFFFKFFFKLLVKSHKNA